MRHETVPAVVEALMAARARVELGWCQGFTNVYRPEVFGGHLVCAGYAVSLCGDGSAAAREALRRALPPGFSNIPSFNDDRATTKEMVLAAFDRAIAAELAK